MSVQAFSDIPRNAARLSLNYATVIKNKSAGCTTWEAFIEFSRGLAPARDEPDEFNFGELIDHLTCPVRFSVDPRSAFASR
jgi:hypothetical protein